MCTTSVAKVDTTSTPSVLQARQVPGRPMPRTSTVDPVDVKYLYEPCTTTVAKGRRVNNNRRRGSDKTSEIDFMDRQVL